MMRQGRVWDIEFFLNLAHHQTVGMGGEQQLHYAEPGFGPHGGKHVSELGNLLG